MPLPAAPDPQRRLTRLQRFPVSILLTLQLGLTVIVPAMLQGTEPFRTILLICTVAVAAALSLEALGSPLLAFQNEPRPIPLRSARWIWVIGILAVVVSTLGGQGSYAVQVGLATESPLTSLATPFVPWALFGAILHMWFHRNGTITRRQMWWCLGTVAGTYAAAGLYRAILGQAGAAILTLLVVAVLMGTIRLRTLAVIIAVLVVIWPKVYDFRDSMRKGVTGYSSQVSAEDPIGRLQLDQEMAVVGRFPPGGGEVQAPTAFTIIRTGLLPSAIDSPRPPLDTGSQLSTALGGSPLNSRSATFFGNVYILEGITAVALAAAVLTLVMGLAMRRSRSPWWLMVAALLYQFGLSFNASYPNGIAQFLQGLEALVAAYALVHLRPRSKKARKSGQATPLREPQRLR